MKHKSAAYRCLYLYALAFTLCGMGCKPGPTHGFQNLSASQTGISFTNTLHKAPLFNILYYLYYYNGAGVAAGDINNDGLPDLFFTANHPGGNKLYLNKGNFNFEDITAAAGIAGNNDWSTGATMADVNGDGLLDIYVTCVAGLYELQGKNELYLNKGNGQFEPVAEKMGLAFAGLGTQAAFFDYDHDGDLDMYLLNHSKKPHANIVDISKRMVDDALAGDRLYRHDVQDGQIRFTEVGKAAGIYRSGLGYGLGLAVADFNNDGWEDIYVGNDFHENDYYYLNNGNGTFTEAGSSYFRHYSRFSMGNDAADFNNDGQIDIVTVDMLPPDEKTLKTYGSDENPNMYKIKLEKNGYQHQYSRNALQLNQGDGKAFSDVALQAGVPATDWSWCPLFADFDNDGLKDLFVSSGIVKRPVDLDYVQFVSAMQQEKGLEQTDKFDEEVIDKMPDGSRHPFFFKNRGNLLFDDVSAAWGTEKMKGYFNGAAYADFDADGRLDVAINCIDARAVILKNNTSPKNYLKVSLKGNSGNTFGVGAKVYLWTSAGMQLQQLMPTRGFQSCSEPVLHFGLDSLAADSVMVVWPDSSYEVKHNLAGAKSITFNRSSASRGKAVLPSATTLTPEWVDQTVAAGIGWTHKENEYVDFNLEYLLPHKQSTRGPALALADVNGDGRDDFFAGGALGQPAVLGIQQANGRFATLPVPDIKADSMYEDVAAVFADFNGDGKPDLMVASGGYEHPEGHPLLRQRLYLNQGSGRFVKDTTALPPLSLQATCVAAGDYDTDGDIDLCIGTLNSPGKFGNTAAALMLANDGKGRFTVDKSFPAEPAGFFTAAAFADLDKDGQPELIAAGEWMPVVVYKFRKGSWQRNPIAASRGLWQSLEIADINGDGLMDILAGNWGANSKLACGKDGGLKMFTKDFDKNGREEQIVSYSIGGKDYTFLAKDELERALPVLKKAYLTYREVAGETVQYLFYDLFKDYREWQCETLSSTVFVQDKAGAFAGRLLPAAWQMAPVFAFASFAGGKEPLTWAGGNFYGTVPYEGRYDALVPSAYTFSASTTPVKTAHLPELHGEVRQMKTINWQGKKALLVARNNQSLSLLTPNE